MTEQAVRQEVMKRQSGQLVEAALPEERTSWPGLPATQPVPMLQPYPYFHKNLISVE